MNYIINIFLPTVCRSKKQIVGGFFYTLCVAILSPGVHMFVFHILQKDFVYKEFHADFFFMAVALLIDSIKGFWPTINNKEIKFKNLLSFVTLIISGIVLTISALIYGIVMYDIVISIVPHAYYPSIEKISYGVCFYSIIVNFLSVLKWEESAC